MTKNPNWDHYPVYHPLVLSCMQHTTAISTLHDVSNIHNHEDINIVILPLVGTTHPRPYMFLSLGRRHEGDMNLPSSINTPSWRYKQSLDQSGHTYQRACKSINRT